MKIKNIKTENRLTPFDIGCKNPIFSWQFEEEEFENQSSYRIVVSSKPDMKGDMWDSGEVFEPNLTFAEYRGMPLKSFFVYYVTIVIRSEKGNVATADTYFETALLFDEDWHGRFIGTNLNYTGNSTIARKLISVKQKKVLRARAYVIGIGYHVVYWNGNRPSDEVLAPSVSDYFKKVYYKTYDITPYIREGQNCFAVEIGYGWYGNKTLKAEIRIEYEDGETDCEFTSSDAQWWITGGSYFTNSVYGGEVKNANLPFSDGAWKESKIKPYFDNGWMCALYQPAPETKIEADFLEPIRVCGRYVPQTVKRFSENTYIYDFGWNIAGWVTFSVVGEQNTRIVIDYAEDIKKDGDIDKINLRSATARDEYILCGEGEERYRPEFTFHGFRYVRVRIIGNADITDIAAEHVHTDLKKTGNFVCSDVTLNRLHEVVLQTELNNIQSLMTDCPQRDERVPWLNDLTSRIFQNVHNFDMRNMYRKTCDDISATMNADGAIADTAPYIIGYRPADPVSASYILMGILSYRYYGDVAVLKSHYGNYVKWVEYLQSRCENGLLTFSYYGDWVLPKIYESEVADNVFVSSIFLYWQYKLMAEAAKILGFSQDISRFEKRAEELKKRINAKYYDFSEKDYRSSVQGMLALALGIGIVPEEDREAVFEKLVRNINAHGNHSVCGNQSYRHMFYELCENGRTDLALDILRNKDYPGWGYMLECGATTLWERWEREIKTEMNSFDHPMFTGFDAIFYRYLGGIRINDEACACNAVTLSPEFSCGLNFVHCSLDTVRGEIRCDWERKNGTIDVKIKIPPTVTAKINFGKYKCREDISGQYGCGEYCFTVEDKVETKA